MIYALEKNFAFKYPTLLHRLSDDGMLDWGKLGPKWHEEFYPRLRKNPPFLLFASDFKLITPDEVTKAIVKIRSKSDIYSHVVPFGKTAAGDFYCFVYRKSEESEFICKFNKRSEESIKLAANIEDFMFRELLGAVVDIDQDEFQNDEISFTEDLMSMLNSHRKYLTEHRFSILETFYHKAFSEHDDTFGALSINNFFEILKTEIYFDGMGQTFEDLSYIL